VQTPWGDVPAGSPISMSEQYELLRSRVSRRGVLKGAALLSAGPLLLRTTLADAAAPAGPRWIGFGDDPQTTMTISSSMAGSFRSAMVEYGAAGSFGSSMQLDVRGVAGVGTRYGSARLTGLSPGSAYSYRIRVDRQTSATSTFRTAPAEAAPFTFTAFGDEGASRISKTIVAGIAGRKPQFHLLAGDLCYADADGQGLPTDRLRLPIWDRWLRLIEPVAAEVPWMTTAGNHEMEPGFGPQGYDGYLARFALPTSGASGCPSTYHFRYGSVAFVQVDSNEVSYEIPHNLGYSHGAQDSWLESVLGNYRKPGSGIDFIVVTMHHCAYSTNRAHGSEGGVRDHWTPLFDRYSVDLVISGHNHCYERSHPVRSGVTTQHAPPGTAANSALGTTYLTVGGGGVNLSTSGFLSGTNLVSTLETSKPGTRTTAVADWSATHDASYCYAACKFTPGTADAPPTLALTMHDQSEREIDAVRLERGVPRPSSKGATDTGLYVGVGIGTGAVALAAAGGAAYAVHRRRSLDH
jgi:hypothetical protein